MSHKDKLGFMEKAKQEGYKLYLYYIATEAPEININRVKIRIEQQGYAVNETKITDRYYRSLQNLKPAVKFSNRAYIFDNSGKISKLIAEITDGEDVMVIDEKDTPNWFKTYLFE
jgi:predicted ABC-type ATPase